jgi:hypothetical protein
VNKVILVGNSIFKVRRMTKTMICTDSDRFFIKNSIRVGESSSPNPTTCKIIDNPPLVCNSCKKELDYGNSKGRVRINNNKIICKGCFTHGTNRFQPCVYLLYANVRGIQTYKIGKTFYSRARVSAINRDWGLKKDERFKILDVFVIDVDLFETQKQFNGFLLTLEKKLHSHYQSYRLVCNKGVEYFHNLYEMLKDESFIDVCERYSKEKIPNEETLEAI